MWTYLSMIYLLIHVDLLIRDILTYPCGLTYPWYTYLSMRSYLSMMYLLIHVNFLIHWNLLIHVDLLIHDILTYPCGLTYPWRILFNKMDTGIGPGHVRIRAKISAVMHEVNPWKVSLPNVFAKIDKIVYMFTSWIFDILIHGHFVKGCIQHRWS
jgi:hypothetical protein